MARVLIIEDELPLIKVLRRIISDMGHEVLVATDGQQGLSLAHNENVDIITSDLQLPGEPSGLDLIRSLRKARPTCPIIIVSGYPSTEIISDCENLGVIDFLTKPFEVTFVREVINSALNIRSTPDGTNARIIARHDR